MSTLPALIALAVIAAPSKPSTSPLEGCAATPVEHGWQYECADVRARLEDRPEDADKAAKYLAAMLQAAPAMIGDGSRTRTEKRKLGGSDVEVLVTEAAGQPVAAFLAGIQRKAGTRILACNGENRRCASVLSSLAEMPWDSANAQGSLRRDPAPLAIAGRAVQVPASCKSSPQPRGGRVVCANTSWVGWVSMDEASARRMRVDFGANMRKTLAKPGWKSTESEVPCTVAGATTSCARVLAEAGSDTLLILWAIAPAGTDFTFASCMARSAKLGSPCSLVFESVGAR